MTSIRALIRDHRTLTILLVAIALFVKVLVPAGYMADTGQKLFSVQICLDGIKHQTIQIAIPSDGSSHDNSHGHDGKADSPCAFTALSLGALGGADAPLLALAIAFILSLGFAPIHPVLRDRASHLRPPLRGPPALG